VGNDGVKLYDRLGLAVNDFKALGKREPIELVRDGKKGYIGGATTLTNFTYDKVEVVRDTENIGLYALKVHGARVEGEWWYSEIKGTKEHEKHQVDLFFGDIQAFEDSMQQVRGCKTKMECYKKHAVQWRDAYYYETLARNGEYDCEEYGAKYPSACSEASAARAKADTEFQKLKEKLAECDK